jgi:hypothetical protein
MDEILSVRELERRAEAIRPLLDGEARTVPVPVRAAPALSVAIAIYRQPARRGQEIFYPPYYMAELLAVDGTLVQERFVRPSDLGVSADPKAPIEGYGLEGVSPAEFHAAGARIREISPSVWRLFAKGGPAKGALVKEYATLFPRCVYAKLKPYYRAMAPAFFAWLT